MVENSGHSATVYKAAKNNLEKKDKGKCRALALQMQDPHTFKTITEENEDDLECFSELLDHSTDSVPHKETGIELYKQLSQLWAAAGMHVRKWLSNALEVVEQVKSADSVNQVDLDKGDIPAVNTLGFQAPDSQSLH